MSRVDMLANVCYRFLDGHRNQGYLINEIISGVKDEYGVTLRNNASLHTALHRCREQAIADGKFLPYPCPYNGMTWAITDDPNMVFDSQMHCYKEVAGWNRAADLHAEFVQRRRRELPRQEQRVLRIVEEHREDQRRADTRVNELIGIIMEGRREARVGMTTTEN